MIISEEVFFTEEPTEVVSMVGSSVAVTLYDRVRKTGGVLHFFEPEWSGVGIKSHRYGDVGVEDLVKRFINSGSERVNLIANIIGGATLGEFSIETLPIGLRNVQSAKKVLDQEEIAIDMVEVGKEIGRYISFNSETGEVKIKENRITH
jgi:chemotaxis protein CheD